MAGVLEGLSAEKTISAFYIAYFGRAADPQGFSYWLGDVARGQSLTQIANNFAPQGETAEQYPFLVNDTDGDGDYEYAPISDTAFFRERLTDTISDIYVNLFGREPTAAELAEGGGVDYWVDEILVRGRPLGEIAIAIANGASPADAAVLLNKIEVAEDFVFAAQQAGLGDQASEVTAEFKAAAAAIVGSVDETEESVTAAQDAIADFVEGGIPGASFTLTNRIGENVVGTAANETFNAVIGEDATLQTFDTVDGAGGTDTLNLIVTGDDMGEGEIASSATIRNIEIINLDQSEDYIETLDVTRFQGATQVWQIGDYSDTIEGVGATTTIGFRDTGANADIEFTGAAGSIALDNADVFLDGSIQFNVFGEDLATLNVSGSLDIDADQTATLVLTADLAEGVDAEDAALTTVNLSISSNFELVTGGEGGFTNLATLNASGSTGDVTIDVFGAAEGSLALETVTLGTGDDTVIGTVGALTAEEVTVDLGAGDDELILASTAQDEDVTTVTITLGEGSDEVTFADLANLVVDFGEETIEGVISITDFDGAEDVVNFGVSGDEYTVTNIDEDALEGAETLFDALDYIANQMIDSESTDDTYAVFQYGENTYVFDIGGFGQGGLVELTGFTGTLNSTNSTFNLSLPPLFAET